MKPPPPTSRSVQYVVRLGSSERAQLEAILAHEHRRRGESDTLTIADVLRIIIAEAAKRRGCHPEHDGGPRGVARVEADDDSGVRIEVRRGSGKPARSRRS